MNCLEHSSIDLGSEMQIGEERCSVQNCQHESLKQANVARVQTEVSVRLMHCEPIEPRMRIEVNDPRYSNSPDSEDATYISPNDIPSSSAP